MAKAKARMYALIDKANIMIIVSHDHLLVQSLCNRVIWLDHGKIVADGDPVDVIERYLSGRKNG